MRNSQEPMVNPLMLEVGVQRSFEEEQKQEVDDNGESNGWKKKVRREFKEPSSDQ